MRSLLLRPALSFLVFTTLAASCIDRAPDGLRRTPAGPGATVRYDLAHRPLPDIPLPIDTATWPDPTSRTGLRINASLVAPTAMEQTARQRFSELEGWGTFSPISVSFDVDRSDPAYAGYEGAAIDLANVRDRHQGDDYDFANDAVYLVNLESGLPVPLDVGAGNFNYTLKKLDSYWANDTRKTERNILFETRDELITKDGLIAPEKFGPRYDTDFDGVLDRPNLDDPRACPAPDLARCDDSTNPDYPGDECTNTRRKRDRCIADHLLTFYERESDTLILRPLVPLDEMTRYAVVLTDRLVDGRGHPVKSPFEFVYHATQETAAARVRDIVNDPSRAAYFGTGAGGLAGTGLDHVGFVWSYTTQPTVDDMKKLRDGLYGYGPFRRFAGEFPAAFEVERAVGLTAGLTQGATEGADWATSDLGKSADCPSKIGNLYVLKYDDLKERMRQLLVEGLDLDAGPGVELLLDTFENIDYMLVGTYRSPFLLEGGPKNTDPNAAFNLNYLTGEGEVNEDTVQFWLVVPKATKQFHQPFNVNIYGHGYTGNFVEEVLYAGNMAQHGLATIGINAVNHGLAFDEEASELAAKSVLASACVAPFYDAITAVRSRDLDGDGIPDSGGDFWSSYIFHTRDSVRQSILDHLQLVRILRSFGTPGAMLCRNAKTGWDKPGTEPCDVNGDGVPEVAGDFDADGVPDVGGPTATYGTWGESLGGILSGIHGAIDAYVTAAVPGSGGGGLTDIAARSFQGGVIEAVLLRLWGPLVVAFPSTDRPTCGPDSREKDHCTVCGADQVSLRFVVPDVNGTGEIEIQCLDPSAVVNSTVFVHDTTNDELRCARVDDSLRFRVGIPTSIGDALQVRFLDGADIVDSYGRCGLRADKVGAIPRTTVAAWGRGRFGQGAENQLPQGAVGYATCGAPSCRLFQGVFFGEGDPLTAPAEGLGEMRQTPAFRRFISFAEMALEPGDPISYAPYYGIKQMTDPEGRPIAPHAVLTLNTVGDMNVPLNSGIAFARATGALPFLRPDQASVYPEYSNYVTPAALFDALGSRTPNQVLIDSHVVEGIAPLARHPAGPQCAASQNAKDPDGTFTTFEGDVKACFPTGCTEATESDPDSKKHVCFYDTHCDVAAGKCVPNALEKQRCEEALFDVDDLDEGDARYYEQNLAVPLRLARFATATSADAASIDSVWAPRLGGVPKGKDGGWTPDPKRPLAGLLDAYIVPQGVHTFVNGEPCQSFDAGTYLTNLTARFFQTNGTDIYYLSHPATHHCLGTDAATCGYLEP